MKTPSMSGGHGTGCCLVLMMKSPERSKRRLAAEIGPELATQAAEQLLACAREDLAGWPGPTCVALSAEDERDAAPPADTVIVQRGGNLGERINYVNSELVQRGCERQLFIGIDCPSLDVAYLTLAANALADHDAVLGPADDGGVVVMGVRGHWPELGALPWSTGELREALRATCAAASANATVAMLPARQDVDALGDLRALRTTLDGDTRPARRALARWLDERVELGA